MRKHVRHLSSDTQRTVPFPNTNTRLAKNFMSWRVFSPTNTAIIPPDLRSNPDGTRHSPFSKDGCTILVKLRQFEQTDDRHFSINTATADWKPRGLPGLSVIHLHEHETETVRLVKFDPGARVEDDPHPGGEELLVLEGTLNDEHGNYPAGTWLRQPDGSRHSPWSDDGCVLWVKRGHLPPA